MGDVTHSPEHRTVRRPRSIVAGAAVAVALALPLALTATGVPWVAAAATNAAEKPNARTDASTDPSTARGIRGFEVKWRRVASSFSAPTQVTSARDGTKRLFVVQQGGRVRVVRHGKVLRRPYIAIGGRVRQEGEGGLLSVAFSPSFRKDGLLWVTYARELDGDLVVARMKTRRPKAPHIRTSTLHPILRIEHSQYTNHYGGQLAFGLGKRLFIGTGDGGSGGDPSNHAQNRKSLLGKVLRINPFDQCQRRAYCIPRGNPLKGKPGRDEIWLLGVRNPWRFSFDQRTNDLWIGDVGQDRYEEIDRVGQHPQRINLGWSCREGHSVYNASRCRRSVDYVDPKVVIRHPAAESITGGFVYRGRRYARQIAGAYVFADFISHRVWLYKPGVGKVVQRQRLNGGPTSFGVDDRGEIYAVTYDGTLWRMRVVRG
jgi:glucose/arabinose dehydrogenase